MLARAPGKVVISGAYAVLEGAPAIVSAVDRHAYADSSRPAELVTEEMRAALAALQDESERAGWLIEQSMVRAPYFDASELRHAGNKLGLGSSAAILVASLAALALDHTPNLDAASLRERVFSLALSAHRRAQGGGSGIDVAASTFGGTLIAQRTPKDGAGELRLDTAHLVEDCALEVWTAGAPASTSVLLAQVDELKRRDTARYAALIERQAQASVDAVRALNDDNAQAFIEALRAQLDALDALGTAAGAAIVTPAVRQVAALSQREGAVVLPSGAGGGDIVLFAGLRPPSSELRQRARQLSLAPLPLQWGTAGVQTTDFAPWHTVPASPDSTS